MAPFPAVPSWLHLLGLFWLPTVHGGKLSMLPHNAAGYKLHVCLSHSFRMLCPSKP